MKHDFDVEYYSTPKHRNPKAYQRFKELNTDYRTKKCNYGGKINPCNSKCIFWNTCKHGKHEYEWKGDGTGAQSNAETNSHK